MGSLHDRAESAWQMDLPPIWSANQESEMNLRRESPLADQVNVLFADEVIVIVKNWRDGIFAGVLRYSS
jgi:hypothetical protein